MSQFVKELQKTFLNQGFDVCIQENLGEIGEKAIENEVLKSSADFVLIFKSELIKTKSCLVN